MNTSPIEIEAKFIVPDAATFAALQKTTRLGQFELNPIGVKIVLDRYIDTADKRIFQAGFACRVRTSQEKKILTLKSLTPAEGDIHRRQEIEMEIDTDQPQAWAEGQARQMVLEMAGTAPLQTLFNLNQTRHKFHALRQGQPVIECSLDEVSLHEEGVVDYFEFEAELIQAGTEADLHLFLEGLQAEAVQAQWSLRAESQSKFERGLAAVS